MGHHRVKYGLPLEPLLGGLCKGCAVFWLLARMLEGWRFVGGFTGFSVHGILGQPHLRGVTPQPRSLNADMNVMSVKVI